MLVVAQLEHGHHFRLLDGKVIRIHQKYLLQGIYEQSVVLKMLVGKLLLHTPRNEEG